MNRTFLGCHLQLLSQTSLLTKTHGSGAWYSTTPFIVRTDDEKYCEGNLGRNWEHYRCGSSRTKREQNTPDTKAWKCSVVLVTTSECWQEIRSLPVDQLLPISTKNLQNVGTVLNYVGLAHFKYECRKKSNRSYTCSVACTLGTVPSRNKSSRISASRNNQDAGTRSYKSSHSWMGCTVLTCPKKDDSWRSCVD